MGRSPEIGGVSVLRSGSDDGIAASSAAYRMRRRVPDRSTGPSSTTSPRYITEHAIADVAHHVEIVADEEIGQPEFALQIDQQIEHLRLDRLVQRGDRFIEDHQPRRQRQRAGDY